MRFFIDADRDIVAMDGNSDVAVVWSGGTRLDGFAWSS
jgi:hypothetical protein